MSDIQKQLALALQQLQQASEAQYDDLQRQLNDLNEQLISVTQDLSSKGGESSSVGGSMKKTTNGRSICESCKNGMFYQYPDADRPKFECLIASELHTTVASCNQFDKVGL
ncbi:MAG: hypothetical protein VYE37_15360 [Pseudomonadota bacterium]|nr:hypothetical protein [Pseudomonadota bacterium]